jgi:hypothetical protein
VNKLLQQLAADRPPLAKKIRGQWVLTKDGEKEAAKK